MGLFYSYFGIIVFLFAVESAFMPVARTLGSLIAKGNPSFLVVIGFVMGAMVVLAEPAIWVLTEEVEERSQGRIKRNVMMGFMAMGVAVAVSLAMVRILTGVHILLLIIPIYALILLLLPFVPPLFAGIAFDSGGVATGPMSSTFLLPFVSYEKIDDSRLKATVTYQGVSGSGIFTFRENGKIKKVRVVAQRAHHRPAQTIETHFVQQQHGLARGKTHGCTDGLIAATGLQVRHVGRDLLRHVRPQV